MFWSAKCHAVILGAHFFFGLGFGFAKLVEVGDFGHRAFCEKCVAVFASSSATKKTCQLYQKSGTDAKDICAPVSGCANASDCA